MSTWSATSPGGVFNTSFSGGQWIQDKFPGARITSVAQVRGWHKIRAAASVRRGTWQRKALTQLLA